MNWKTWSWYFSQEQVHQIGTREKVEMNVTVLILALKRQLSRLFEQHRVRETPLVFTVLDPMNNRNPNYSLEVEPNGEDWLGSDRYSHRTHSLIHRLCPLGIEAGTDSRLSKTNTRTFFFKPIQNWKNLNRYFRKNRNRWTTKTFNYSEEKSNRIGNREKFDKHENDSSYPSVLREPLQEPN